MMLSRRQEIISRVLSVLTENHVTDYYGFYFPLIVYLQALEDWTEGGNSENHLSIDGTFEISLQTDWQMLI